MKAHRFALMARGSMDNTIYAEEILNFTETETLEPDESAEHRWTNIDECGATRRYRRRPREI